MTTAETANAPTTSGATTSRRVQMVCANCGSTNVLADAFASWNETRQCWEVASVMDKGHACEDCKGDARLVERELDAPATTAGDTRNNYKGDAFADVMQDLASRRDAYDLAAVAAAQQLAREGEIEVDDVAITSRGDDAEGCYVGAWMWVPADRIEQADPVAPD